MTRLAILYFLAGLFCGVVAGILLWPFLVWRESGSESVPEPAATESRTICGKCGHEMHWRSCDTLVTVPGGLGVCLCRNDIAESA